MSGLTPISSKSVIPVNRSQRRRNEIAKTKKTPTYNYTEQQLRQIILDGVTERVNDVRSNTITYLSAAFLISLHDEFEFGNKRIARLLERVKNQFECIEAGTVTMDDIVDWCKQYGVKLEDL